MQSATHHRLAIQATALKYAKIFGIGLQNTVVYRWNFLLRAGFHVVPLMGTLFFWRALFEARGGASSGEGGAVGGYTYQDTANYFLLVILLEGLITPSEDEWQIAADIRDGGLNALLSKPLSYFGYRTCLFGSSRVVYTLITLPITAGLFAAFGSAAVLPQAWTTWLWAGFSLGMAALLQFFIAYAVAMLAFWLLEISTVVFILFSFEYFLSGQLFPLDLTPAWFRSILEWLPFTYELFFPVAIFLEKVRGADLYRGLLIQAGWVLVAWLGGRWLWTRGLRRYGAVGG